MGVILKVGDEVLSRITICCVDLCDISTVINNLTCTWPVGAGTNILSKGSLLEREVV